MADEEMTGCLADVDAMVAVGGMAGNPFVLFVEGIHGVPSERNPSLQSACVRGQVDVSPRSPGRALLACLNGIPGSGPKIEVPRGVVGRLQSVWRDVRSWKVGHRIAARLKEQEDVLAIGNPVPTETHAHSPTQRLNVQQPFG